MRLACSCLMWPYCLTLAMGPAAPEPKPGLPLPLPLSAAVSRQMARMPRRDTKPELALRRELHRRGLRFRVALAGLPGRPDIVLTRARVAVFVDGCFWHRCPSHGTEPKNNATWWRQKLDRNVERDAKKDALLAEQGWSVIRVWEHEAPASAADRVEAAWRRGLGT